MKPILENRSKSVTIALAAVLALLTGINSTQAGSFFSDFNSGLPPGTTVYGNSTNQSSGGYTNSGYLQLTPLALSQNGSFILNTDLDGGNPVVAFTATFKAYMYSVGTGADGISFNFAPDLPAGTITEEGAGTGVIVAFDTFANENESAGIDVKVLGPANQIATSPLPDSMLRPGTWVDVTILLQPDGFLDVAYDGTWVYTNLNLQWYGFPTSVVGYHFGFGARTGGFDDLQGIDNLNIVTYTTGSAFVDHYFPIGRNVRADSPIVLDLSDYQTSQIDAASITLKLDGVAVVPTIEQTRPATKVTYQPPVLLASGSSHAVEVIFADNSPTPLTTTWRYNFTVGTYSTLAANLVAAPALVSPNPGFALRVNEMPMSAGNDLSHAEPQLAGLLIDPLTSLPYTNLATLSVYAETNVINYSQAGTQGSFPTESPASIPGLPGYEGGTSNAVIEVVTYLYLTNGIQTLGVNSSDGFELTVASTPDAFVPNFMINNGTHAAAEATLTFAIIQSGYYPFRVVYFNGGPEAPYPSANNPSLEFFSVDAVGNKALINDTNVIGHIPAAQPAQTLPYVRSVSPAPGTDGVATNTAVDVALVDGSITVQTNTIQLLVNSNAVVPAISAAVGGITTVHYSPPGGFLMDTTNTLQIAFTDSASNRRTNVWQFASERIMSWLWRIAPNSTPWVNSAGGTERGMALNPKTGHVLVLSRAAAAPVNGLGIGIFDGNDGHYIGQMNMSGITADGTYTFILNMIGVAEDGVIYACDLTTSVAHYFRIYRWQNEGGAPTLAWSGNPTGGKTRWGDAIRVRGSGAGTRIVTGSDDPANTGNPALPMFTTVDGTNFTLTALSIAGGVGGGHRLGLAFDCTNSIYGCVNGTPIQYVGFNGPPSTVASRIAQMNIYDINGTSTRYIAPIGLDVINRRLYGLGSGSAPSHNVSMFDLPIATSGNVVPRDAKAFPRAATSWATGNVDMTPDGTKVYGLDTGNGVIAFTVAPKLAVPEIWGQPRNCVVAVAGSVGFFDVEGVGAPQNYQWCLNGAPLPNANGRTLDIYNVQSANLGWYSVIITNNLGSVTSAVAYMDTQLFVTNSPGEQVVPVGGTASFTAQLVGGKGPYTYQWQFKGTNLTGAVSSVLTIPDAQVLPNAGTYTVVATDSLGQTVTSAPATLYIGTFGAGTGLAADYYNVPVFAEATPPDPFDSWPAYSTVDPIVDFDWGTGGLPGTGSDYVTVRWHGQLQPLYSQDYTLYTTSDDGSRVWVNGQLVVNNWFAQPPTERSGVIPLVTNQKYDLLMEYFEKEGGAVARLSWSSDSQPKQSIPMRQLYPVTGPFYPSLTSQVSNHTNLVLNWSGTCILESAPLITGPWTPVLTNAGPVTITIGAEREMYFRLFSQQSF